MLLRVNVPRFKSMVWFILVAVAVVAVLDVGCSYISRRRLSGGILDIWGAASIGNAAAVEKFLKEGVPVDAKRAELTPLQHSGIGGHGDIAQLLISHGAKADIYVAAGIGDTKNVESLLQGGADINASYYTLGTPVVWAARNGHLDVVKQLVASGASLKPEPGKYETALHSAAKNGHLEVLNYLIDKKADLNVRDDQGYTPLITAVVNNKLSIVEALLSRGAEVDKPDWAGYTALRWAVNFGFGGLRDQRQMVKLLVSAGADPYAKGNNGSTPMSEAIEHEQTDLVSIMRKR